MQDETSRMPAEEDERVQKGILVLLLGQDAQRPWSVAEVEREIGEQIATADGLASLHAAGLIHRCGEFVFATRAALHMDGLSL
jgi:HD-like signal output (HDOD) protein